MTDRYERMGAKGREWLLNSLRTRRRDLAPHLGRLRKAYSPGCYLSAACEVLAEIDERTLAALDAAIALAEQDE
jgi:hypothetical protein